ncbi:hypothetical protein [Micavibrio aeruginosavorus]|uniref:DUF4124 domain-containing protein n=1 Tax=Micavibrio aeruginosavorus EPB TaxID=349215 RepID=M4VGU5_9BACT|nr:hypothetical protein [Micavibrio aeruginosavorus]AGH97705.1 hypothetical protein A11S_883 [Micavibrio aeruginosavorus EPB]
MKHLLSACMAVALMIGASASARADYFVWQDAETGLSVTFPDTWKTVSSNQPDEILTLMAPAPGDFAVCRIRTNEDRRFVVFPPRMASDVQKISYSTGFWDTYLADYDDVELYGVLDNTGLGRGFGSFAVADFKSDFVGPYMGRRAIASAALYNDRAYVMDCSTREGVFAQWQPLFMSVMGSVDFKKTHDEVITGNYRNFLKDPQMQFKLPGSEATNRY